MDYGRPAAKKESPKRVIIVLVSMILAFVGSGSYHIIKPMYKKTLAEWYITGYERCKGELKVKAFD